jgi:glycosyltransferase involved in cell wall biosynthesis
MAKLRIYSTYKTIDGPWGGANGFIRGLEKQWTASGQVEFAIDIEDEYDLLFLSSLATGPGRKDPHKVSLTFNEIKRLRTRGRISWWRGITNPGMAKKIVFRSVGIEKWSHSRRRLTARDKHVLAAMNIADHVIFQTAYVIPVFREAGYRGERHSVIHNGADSQFFHPGGRTDWNGTAPMRVLSCTFSKRVTKRFDAIAALSKLPGVECTHIGNWPEEIPPEAVRMAGVLEREKIGELMRASHVFMHPAVKDPCPNVIQEALASRLPVFFSRDSGAAELAGDCGVALDQGLEPALAEMRARYSELISNINRHSNRFTVARAAEQYLQIFQKVAASAS